MLRWLLLAECSGATEEAGGWWWWEKKDCEELLGKELRPEHRTFSVMYEPLVPPIYNGV